VSPHRTLARVLLALLVGGCSHALFEASAGQLKSDAEDFEKSLRFQDYGGAAQLVAPSRKQAFLAARRKEGNDLTVTDMEVIDVQIAADAKHAIVMSRMRWVKLPSVSEVTAEVHEVWEAVGPAWQLTALAGGPFPELEPAH
jgi:hypothetical protein